MSECVVRMEMPAKDRMCQMADDIDGVWYCPVMKKLCRQPDNGDIPSWCPIICQLPEGHGRLVDADALNRKRKHLIKTENGVFPKSEWFIKANDLFAAKTIVPAERRET